MKFVLIVDNEAEKVSFFPLWEVICFVLVVTAVLIILFPNHLLSKILVDNNYSVVSVCYLNAFEKRYPKNIPIKLALVQQQAELGDVTQAEEKLSAIKMSKITITPEIISQLQWSDYLILKARVNHTNQKSLEYQVLIKKIRNMSKVLVSKNITVAQLKELAMDNLAYNQAPLSLSIYQMLMDNNKLTTSEDLAWGGNIAMQNNKHLASAEFYMAAYRKTIVIKMKREYAKKVIQVLWAGNYLQEALNYVATLPKTVIDDRDMLLYLAKLAAAANYPDLAQKYAVKALLYEHNRKHE